ncbi:lytic transglycosylase domain-containing protein, partial [Candidatus Saccharibacteria bacterium]|nr:lytic transglycosylase domain-containing protein [Candidatus Saccharibacteria bacterium]
LNNRLLNGESAIMSISGHIVHVKEMNMLGIVVDDPAGSSVLLHKVNGRWISSSDPSVTDSSGKPWYEFKELNSKTPDTANQPGQPGDNHIWPWSDVASYQHFNWVLTMSNPNPSPTPAPVEVVPAPEQSSSPNVDSVSPAVDAPAAETSVEADSESTQVEIDYRALANMQRQILPTTAGIPEEIRTLISPSEHFNAIQIAAQIKNESNFNPGAKSGAGAVGISQFMRGTWEDVARRYPEKTNPTATRTDPSESIIRQGLYMDELYEQVLEYLAKGRIQGDPVDLTLAAYNAGMGNVLKAHGVPNFTETKNYIKRIKQTTAEYVLLVASENS